MRNEGPKGGRVFRGLEENEPGEQGNRRGRDQHVPEDLVVFRTASGRSDGVRSDHSFGGAHMMTLQGLRMKTEWMMNQMHQKAVEDTIERFKKAARIYYLQGYDNGETVSLVRELIDLGVDQGYIIDLEFEIRDEVELKGE